MESENNQEPADWIFAYGSLIWRPDFNYDAVRQARLDGFERRFWQASHDHRGTPRLPGRVVTLAPITASHCHGLAYRLPEAERQDILQRLDEREQDGYQRVYLDLNVVNGQRIRALTWIALEGNPSWVGQEPMDRAADLIATRQGPSGTNRDYLYKLDTALRNLSIVDRYIEALTGCVKQAQQMGINPVSGK